MSVLRAGAHECEIRSAPVLVLSRLQRFSITLKRRQRAKIKFILALCQQSGACHCGRLIFNNRGLQASLGTTHHLKQAPSHTPFDLIQSCPLPK
ncbi:hypothetical protein BPGQ101_05725 [Bacillus altitudinis]|nr:hypothetical protein BPGQ101_05725 [Bacillus altitudinis]